MADKRATIQFSEPPDFWETVESWAGPTKYKLKESSDGKRTYQKGTGFLVAPQMLEIESSGGHTTMQAWIRAGLFVRMMSLFILPAEITIASGGLKAAIPRKMARKDINKLLESLQCPRLE